MKKTILALALAASTALAAAEEPTRWTIHTASIHFGVPDYVELNNLNLGLGYDIVPDEWRVGAYYNSFEDLSVYGARLFPLTDRIRLGLGVVTGYDWNSQYHSIVPAKGLGLFPLVSAEFDITNNVSVVWFGQAVNLEVKF